MGGANDRAKPLPHQRRHLAAIPLLLPGSPHVHFDVLMHPTILCIARQQQPDALLCNRQDDVIHALRSLMKVAARQERPICAEEYLVHPFPISFLIYHHACHRELFDDSILNDEISWEPMKMRMDGN